MLYPKRIVCLTEESVEILYAIGAQDLIVGVSNYVERPPEAKKLPQVSMFIKSQYDKIDELKPDLVLGFSDIQQDIAKELIARGHNVYIANHRSIEEILSYTQILCSMIGRQSLGEKLVQKLRDNIKNYTIKRADPPKIYFEEWDEPMITAIRWVSDIIEICGGKDIFREKSTGSLARERFVTSEDVIERNPDIIFGCWCGKRVRIEKIKVRPGWDKVNAIKNNMVFELDPAIFLQPGPAPILDGLRILNEYFETL